MLIGTTVLKSNLVIFYKFEKTYPVALKLFLGVLRLGLARLMSPL